MTDTNNTDGAALLPVTADFSRATLQANIESILRNSRDVHSHSLALMIMDAIPRAAPHCESDVVAALQALFDNYKELADSGDAGFWSLEDQPVGKQALAALENARHRQSHSLPGDVGGDLAAIGPRPTGKVLAWADPRPCFYANSIGECGTCLGCKERIARAAITPSPLPATQEDAERSERREGFAPCPTCRQYSHSIDDDALANAFMHFEAMAAHPVRGHPMGHIYDDATRDAAQVLVAAAKGASTPQRQEYDGEVGTALVRNEHRVRGSSAPSYCTPYGTAVKQVGHLRAAIEQALKCSPKIRYLPTVPSATIVYDCGDPWEILRAALAHPAQATSSALSGDAGEGE